MKKRFLKFASAVMSLSIALGSAALAAPLTSGGSGTDYSYYWSQDFNDLPASDIKAVRVANSATVSRTGTEDDYALNIAAAASNSMAIIDSNSSVEKPLPKFDFSKGPLVLSYDVTINELNKAVFYMMLRSSSNANADLLGSVRIEKSGRVAGYKKIDSVTTEYATKSTDLVQASSTKLTTAGTVNHIKNAFIYDESSKILTVKYYLNGEQMMSFNDSAVPLEIKYKADNMDALMSGDMFLRFTVAGSGGSVKLDNITLRSEGKIDLPDVSYIGASNANAGVTYTDTAVYDPENKPSSYTKAINKIPVSQTVLSGDNQYYTLTKYNADSNPLLLKEGTPAASKVGWKGDNGITLSSLDIANNKEFYILKLKDTSLITNFAGEAVDSPYSCLRRAALGTGRIAARETVISDENGETITLDASGKLPANAKTIKFITSKHVELTADKVKMVGTDGKEFAGVQSQDEPNVWTIAMEELSEGTEYTITLGDFSQTVTTTGEAPQDPNAFYWYEGFDSYDGTALPEGFSKPGTTTTLEKDVTDGNTALKYICTAESGTSTNFSITDATPLDFSKGALLLSYDMRPLSSLAWISGNSNILVPSFRIGSIEVSQLSIIEYGGIKAAYKATGWNRSGYLSDWANGSLTEGTKVKFQLLLEKDGNQITATQYLNGKPVYYTSGGEEKLAAVTTAVTDEELAKGWTLNMGGRRFTNGLVFDDFCITTVDGVTANDAITIADSAVTVQTDLENTLQFNQNAPSIAKEIKMQNTAAASDFRIKKYNAVSDPLLLSGEAVSGFELNNTGNALIFTKLPERSGGEIFVIELSEPSKIRTLTGKMLDTTVFKAGSNPTGLKKTRLLDSDGDEVYAQNGVVPSVLSKMELMFTKNTELETLPVITNAEKAYSLTAVQGEDGVYIFDFTDSSAVLSPNTVYTVTYGDVSAQFTTDSGTVNATIPVITPDGKASAAVTNTTDETANVYIISAYFNGEEEQVGSVKYEKFVVQPGTVSEISMSEAHTAPSEWTEQRVFIWNGFQNMTPYSAYGSRTNQ